MNSLIFAFNAINPVVLMVVLGYVFKRVELIPPNIISAFKIFLASFILCLINVFNQKSLRALF